MKLHRADGTETLRSLARRHYGHESNWQLIAAANRGVIFDEDRQLRPNLLLIIPASPTEAAEWAAASTSPEESDAAEGTNWPALPERPEAEPAHPSLPAIRARLDPDQKQLPTYRPASVRPTSGRSVGLTIVLVILYSLSAVAALGPLLELLGWLHELWLWFLARLG